MISLCNVLKRQLKSTVFKYSTIPVTIENPICHEEPPLDKLYKTLELELRGNDPAVLKSFSKFALTSGHHFCIKVKAWTPRKPEHERFTVLKSVHVKKKHRVQYEYRTYFSFVQYEKLTGSTANTLLEYLERNLPEGVALKATKVEIQKMPEHLNPPS